MTAQTTATIIPLRPTKFAAPPKRRYVRLHDETRQRVVDQLLRIAATRGLTHADYDQAAAVTGASPRAVQYWVAAARQAAAATGTATVPPRQAPKTKIEITDDVLLCHAGVGITKGFLRAQAKQLIPRCSLNAYRNQLFKATSRDILDGLQRGQMVLERQWVFLDRRAVPFMHHFTFDLFFPGVRCVSTTGEELDPVWGAVRERATGLILAHALWPTREGLDHTQLLALFARAIRGTEVEGVFLGGVPTGLRLDREATALHAEVRAQLGAFDIQVDPTSSYRSWENGAHERMHQVIRREALDGLAASTRGPRDRAKKFELGERTIEFTALAELLARWAWAYTFQRPQKALNNNTPFLEWQERVGRDGPVTRAAQEELVMCAVPCGSAHRTKEGVRYDGRQYIASGLVGSPHTVQLGIWPGDASIVEAYHPADGHWLGTLHDREAAPADVEAAILHQRAANQRTVKALFERAGREDWITNGGPAPRGQTVTAGPASPPGVRPEEPTGQEPAVEAADEPATEPLAVETTGLGPAEPSLQDLLDGLTGGDNEGGR